MLRKFVVLSFFYLFVLSRMQLAINVQISKDGDGVGGSAVYIGCASSACPSIIHGCNLSANVIVYLANRY